MKFLPCLKTMFVPDPVQNEISDIGGRIIPAAVSVRKIPYPYRAMLAICSDLDETPDRDVYFETARFLNTGEATAMGTGVDLEVGNTIYFDMPGSQFSYWNTDDHGRGLIAECIRSGHIDCLHSYGNGATERCHVERALEALAQNNCRLEVWIDHATAPSNFGRDIMQGRGDVPSSEIYHADLSCGSGIQFVWLGRVTSIIGQDSPRSLEGIWNEKRKISSATTILKEAVKGLCGEMGRPKYVINKTNDVIRETTLRDGRRIFEFLRSNPHWEGVSCGATADGIADVLKPEILDRLVQREGICILYTHLGKIGNPSRRFTSSTVKAFQTLSQYSEDQKILVAATGRVLKYRRAAKDVRVEWERLDGCFSINLESSYPDDLDGITLYTEHAEKAVLKVNGRPVQRLQRNPADLSGRKSISLHWKRLEFPI